MHIKWKNQHNAPSKIEPKLSKIALAVKASIVCLGLITGTSQAANIVVTSNRDDNSRHCTLREAIISINNSTRSKPAMEPGCSYSGSFSGKNSESIDGKYGELIVPGGESGIIFDSGNDGYDAGDAETYLSDTITFANSFRLKRNNTITLSRQNKEDDILGIDIVAFATINDGYGTELYIAPQRSITIDASNIPKGITIDAAGLSRVLYVKKANLTLNNITITGGLTTQSGSGINAYSSSITLNNSSVSNNEIADGRYVRGAGISLKKSTATIDGSSISNNKVSGGEYVYGAGISLKESTATINGSTISNNEVSGGEYTYGAGIRSDNSNLSLTNSTVSSNVLNSNGYASGGGINVRNTALSIKSSSIRDNRVSSNSSYIYYGDGYEGLGGEEEGFYYGSANSGGLEASSSTVNISNSVISNNEVSAYANANNGAMRIYGSSVSIDSSTISSNSIYGSFFSERYGSAITITTYQNSTILFNNSTISSNSGNGIGLDRYANNVLINNTTISSNILAGIRLPSNGSLSINNSTISSNDDGLIGFVGGESNISINSTIIANSGNEDCNIFYSSTSDQPFDVGASNIIEDGSCNATRSGDPGLENLANNGGTTRTHALSADSIARNTGNNATCPEQDQRGRLRSDGQCDVGAFEISNEVGAERAPITVPPLDLSSIGGEELE